MSDKLKETLELIEASNKTLEEIKVLLEESRVQHQLIIKALDNAITK